MLLRTIQHGTPPGTTLQCAIYVEGSAEAESTLDRRLNALALYNYADRGSQWRLQLYWLIRGNLRTTLSGSFLQSRGEWANHQQAQHAWPATVPRFSNSTAARFPSFGAKLQPAKRALHTAFLHVNAVTQRTESAYLIGRRFCPLVCFRPSMGLPA